MLLVQNLLVMNWVCDISKEGYLANLAIKEHLLLYHLNNKLPIFLLVFIAPFLRLDLIKNTLRKWQRPNGILVSNKLPIFTILSHNLVNLSIFQPIYLILQPHALKILILILEDLRSFDPVAKFLQVNICQFEIILLLFFLKRAVNWAI